MKPLTINLDHYRRLRERMLRHHNALVKTTPRSTFRKCAKRLGLLEGNTLGVESESELIILTDYCLYSHRQRGRNLVEKYLAKLPPADDPDEQGLREAMSNARFSLFRVEQVIRGTGVFVRDLVRGDGLFVVDELLSRTMRQGRLLGGRLVPFPDYWITTGAGFPVSQETVALVQAIFLPALKFTEGDLSQLRPAADEELATVVIGAALQEGTTSDIEYR
ncbi:MAG: hypothetical protein ACM359_02020 [Bacillota bacterium]